MTPAGTIPFSLERFVTAQEGTYARALSELTRGRKATHWMWFVFPQIAGLGGSNLSHHFALRTVDEARAYLAHPVLGVRYRECLAVLQDILGVTAERVFGPVDAAKLRSSLTLFAEAAPYDPLFTAALDRWFGGVKDERTIEIIGSGARRVADRSPGPLAGCGETDH